MHAVLDSHVFHVLELEVGVHIVSVVFSSNLGGVEVRQTHHGRVGGTQERQSSRKHARLWFRTDW